MDARKQSAYMREFNEIRPPYRLPQQKGYISKDELDTTVTQINNVLRELHTKLYGRIALHDFTGATQEVISNKLDADGVSSWIKQNPDEINAVVSREGLVLMPEYLKDKVYRGVNPPDSPSVGMLWIDQSVTPSQIKTWDGTEWKPEGMIPDDYYTQAEVNSMFSQTAEQIETKVSSSTYFQDKTAMDTAIQAAQNAADAANQEALEAAGIANGKGRVYAQNTAPEGDANSLWIDTTGGANTPKRWDGSAWTPVTDKAALDAAIAAAQAQNDVNNANNAITGLTQRMTAAESSITQQADEIALKVSQSTYDSEKIIRSATAPENPTAQMLWLDISLSPNMLKRWTGSAWAVAGTNAVTASGITIQDDNVTISTPNFNLEILDSSGDPVLTMSAGDAGFDKLYAGKIVSDSVASLGGQGSLSYTVGTGGHFSTISDCLNNLPTLQRGSVKISLVSNLTEIVRIENRTFNKLDIDLGGYTLNGCISIYAAHGPVFVHDGKIVDNRAYSDSQYTVLLSECRFNIYRLTINTNGASSRAICASNSAGWVEDCDINANYDGDGWGCSVMCTLASHIYVSGTRGTARYGVFSYVGSIALISGTAPYGTAAAYVEMNGKVFNFSSTPTQTAQGGAVAVPVTKSFTSTGGGSVRAGDLYQESDVFQGAYTSGKYKRGMWFFNYSAIQSALSGKTVQKVAFTCRRYATANGSASPQQPTFYLHNYTALPNAVPSFSGTATSGVAWDRGDTQTITLPNSFGEALKAGTAKGIAIAAPNNSSPYMKFYPTGAVLTITYV